MTLINSNIQESNKFNTSKDSFFDFNSDTLTKALLDYQSRRRRFGGV